MPSSKYYLSYVKGRNREIKILRGKGKKISFIASKYGLSQRQVLRILPKKLKPKGITIHDTSKAFVSGGDMVSYLQHNSK